MAGGGDERYRRRSAPPLAATSTYASSCRRALRHATGGCPADDGRAAHLAEAVVAVLEDRRPGGAEQQLEALVVGRGHAAAVGYFSTMRIRLRSGTTISGRFPRLVPLPVTRTALPCTSSSGLRGPWRPRLELIARLLRQRHCEGAPVSARAQLEGDDGAGVTG